MVVNPTQDNLFQQSENTIHMYSRPGKTNINDIFTMLTINKGVPQNVKCKKTKIIGFTYEIKKINYVFCLRLTIICYNCYNYLFGFNNIFKSI